MSRRTRAALQAHVRSVQRTRRSCAGCGLCCTEAYNALAILPLEARRIAQHLASRPAAEQRRLRRKLQRTVARYGLADRGPERRYTCAFLERDLTCALPLEVKPVACLAFNPVAPDACDMEVDWCLGVHAEVERENRAAGLPRKKAPIPVAVLDAWLARRPDVT